MSNIGQTQNQAGLLGVMAPSADTGSVTRGDADGFGSVLKSVIASNNVGGKEAINGQKGYKAINPSSSGRSVADKPNFLIMNNNIIKHSINDEDTEKEGMKEASWMMSAFISKFVTEADIKLLIPEGAGDATIDAKTLMSNLEKLLEGKIASGEIPTMGENGENIDPMALLKELQAFLAKNNVSEDGVKGITVDEFKNILSMARSMGMAKGGGDVSGDVTESDDKAESLLSKTDSAKTADGTQIKSGAEVSEKANASVVAGTDNGANNAETVRRTAVVSENAKSTVLPEAAKNTSVQALIADSDKGGQAAKSVAAPTAIKADDPIISKAVSQGTQIIGEPEAALSDESDAVVKDGGIKNAENMTLKEKISSNRINPEIAGNAVNNATKSNVLGDEKIEVRPSLRNETAANLEVFKVKSADSAGGNQSDQNALNLMNEKNGTTFANKNAKEDASNNFQSYLKEEIIGNKETVTPTIKDAPQTYDMREAKDISKFMKTLEMMANAKGESRLTVTLTPENLGRLEIRLVENGGKLTAKFFTDNETSHKMMVAQGEAIRSQLLEKGIVIENMDFGFKDATAGRDGGDGKRSSSSRGGRKGYKDDDSNDEASSTESVTERNLRNNAVYA